MATYAYLRVSTADKNQTTDNQKLALETSDFKIDDYIVEHGVSGGIETLKRKAFKEMLSKLKSGDTVIVTAIDRFARSALDILTTVALFKKMGVKFRVLQLDSVDLTSPIGKTILTVMGAFAELEKSLISERVVSGLERTKSQGTILGKPNKLNPAELKELLNDMSKGVPQTTLTNKYNVSVKTISQFKKEYLNNRNFVVEYEKSFNKRLEQKSVRSLNKDI